MLSRSQIKLAELISQKHDQYSEKTESQQPYTMPSHIEQQDTERQTKVQTNVPVSVEVIEELLEQIQEKEDRLRELNNERNAIHKSLRIYREQLDSIMNQFKLEVIVKNGKEYRKKFK